MAQWFRSSVLSSAATARRELMSISEEQEIAMGREYDPQLVFIRCAR